VPGIVPSVHFTSTGASGSDASDREAQELIASCEQALAQQTSPFGLAAADHADYIVFIEPPTHKFPAYGQVLSDNEIIRLHAERCFAYDWADGPAGFLPGVYPSLPRSRWDPVRVVSGGFLRPYNHAVLETAAVPDASLEPHLLMSFRGASSHPVRKRLLECSAILNDPGIEVSSSDGWFDHSQEEKRAHASRILGAKFALCPRGVGPATFRIYEAMALGRAPVIVSDEWLPPAGPDWPSFSLVVEEARVAELPQIAREREADWVEMGCRARAAWEAHFAHPAGVLGMLEAVQRIAEARARGETFDELRERWSSRAFKSANGWSARQRVARRVRRLTSPAAH
jgi:hypothetical protein